MYVVTFCSLWLWFARYFFGAVMNHVQPQVIRVANAYHAVYRCAQSQEEDSLINRRTSGCRRCSVRPTRPARITPSVSAVPVPGCVGLYIVLCV
jgi:hypothetical protein